MTLLVLVWAVLTQAMPLEMRDSARFLWKTIPTAIKDTKPEIVAAWRIGQKLWTRDYAGVYGVIRGYDWSQELKIWLLHSQSFNEEFLGSVEASVVGLNYFFRSANDSTGAQLK